MDRELSSSEQNKNNLRNIIRWGIIGVGLLLMFWLLRTCLSTNLELDEIRTAKVERGYVENAITASGEVIPAFEQLLVSPINAAIKRVLLKSGTNVKIGDLIMELDAEYVSLEFDKLKDQLELKKNNVTKLKFQYDKDLRDLELDDEIKGLQLSSLEAQLTDMRRLKSVGGATQEEVEKAELDLKIAQLQKKKLENDLDFRQKSLGNDKRNLELEVMIEQKNLAELRRKRNETQVKAPLEGVITWVDENIGKQVAEGADLVRLSNLSSFRVEGSVSDLYTNQIKSGMSVAVRIGKERLEGTLTNILPSVENNTIPVLIELKDPSNKVLRPNMRVEVFIITQEKPDVLRIVNGPAFSGAREQDIFVVEGDVARKRRVRIGLNNIDYVEVAGDIKAGETVIVSDMRDYLHLDEIKLK